MNIFTADNLGKSYGTKVLFENINFGLDDSQKIGLIGINGTGKSTLLKIIAGAEIPDTGKITLAGGLKIGFLLQNPEFQTGATVLEQVFKGNSPVMQLLREYEYVLEKVQQQPEEPAWQTKLLALGQKMDEQGAWQLESEAKAILTRLKISDFDARIELLSGGMRKRVALASALITPSDLLILDEPTNHIDSQTADWLEQYLNQRKGTLILITHDRFFLDRVTNTIFELDRGKLYSYSGNYSVFLESKIIRQEQEQARESKRQNLLRNELSWVRRGAKARTTKQKARLDRFYALESQKPAVSPDKIEISSGSSRLGKKVIEIENISKQFSGRQIIKNFSYIVAKGDRIGIIGPNGCGKSTLLNIMAGSLTPDGGRIEVGETVKIGYFSQENVAINENLKVIDYIKEEAEIINTGAGAIITASQMLDRFLFPPRVQWTLISKLSGGEKRRLYLLRILMSAPNVLLLDEPTNDLDIQTLTILEDYLDNFPGAVIAVSHDRYFLDRVAEKILAFKPGGEISHYTGNYSEYLDSQTEQSETNNNKTNFSKQFQTMNNSGLKNPNIAGLTAKPAKFTFKEQKEYEQIDNIIAETEKELEEVNARINLAGSDYGLLIEMTKKQQELQERLQILIERWAYLSEIAEEIDRARKKG
ncbi:MAG: ABC-F family ATP-binding cassette domain-containing protein [Firmicutes bacterium]|nr:ABC-F family ATP-binding cassette domain-containing protein [Bacillota bacterium]